jgi:hypothetical protein
MQPVPCGTRTKIAEEAVSVLREKSLKKQYKVGYSNLI